MPHFILILLALTFSLTACSTYRKSNSSYRSTVGGYRVASDYSEDAEGGEKPFVPKGAFQLQYPVRNVRVNRGFRPSSDRNHDGVDFGGKKGAPILSAHEGVVIYTGSDFRGYGKMVLVEYNHEWATIYAHLSSIDVEPGQIVDAGTEIGGMGRTGKATGVHLHFELLRNRKPVDPLPFLSRINRFARKE